jgi:dephospho-CoA kinase
MSVKTVGITGGIGSGKTTICKIIYQLGYPVFIADEEAKKIYQESWFISLIIGRWLFG